MRSLLLALTLAACTGAAQPLPPLSTDAQIDAPAHAPAPQGDEGYVAPIAPFRVIGNVYYVGPHTVSSFPITTPQGHFLVDGGAAQAAPLVESNIAASGFSIHDVKYLLNTHAHYDHAGGLAQLKRDSGAALAASAGDRPYLETGRIGYGPSPDTPYPAVRVDRVLADGDRFTLGDVTLTAHLTPRHTPGCTSWSVDAAGVDGAAHHVFIDCSETVAAQRLVPESYPGMVQSYRTTFARVRAIHADVFLASHGSFFDLDGKRARPIAGDANAFVDPDGLQHYNDDMETQFNAELARESAAH